MAIEDQVNNVKSKLREWENEMMKLDEQARKETSEAGQKIRQKYDTQIEKLKSQAQEAQRKLGEIVE